MCPEVGSRISISLKKKWLLTVIKGETRAACSMWDGKVTRMQERGLAHTQR